MEYVLAMAALAFLAYAFRDRTPAMNAAWAQAAAALGLRFDAYPPQITGRGLRIDFWRSGDEAETRFRLSGIPPALAFHGQPLFGEKRPGRTMTGDPNFDALAHVFGEPADVLALMDLQTRRDVGSFVALGGELEDGTLKLHVKALVRQPQALVQPAKLMLSIGARLVIQEREELLLANVKGDPWAEVREANLAILTSLYPDAKQTRAAIAAALEDEDPKVRFDAAVAAKDHRVLRALAANVEIDADVRADALERLDYDAKLVTALLADGQARVRRAAVAVAGRAHDLSQLEALSTLTADPDEKVAQAVAHALGKLGGAQAEPALIALLAHPAGAAQIAAAEALGATGSVRAVEPLLPLTKGVFNADLRAAARDAIRRIQARLGDADAGRLSLADRAEGELSLPDGEPGELSMTDGSKPRPR